MCVLRELVAEQPVCPLAAAYLLHPTLFTGVRGEGEFSEVRLTEVPGSSPPALCIASVLHWAVFLCAEQGDVVIHI